MRSIEVFIQGHGLPEIIVLTADSRESIAAVVGRIEHPAAKEVDLLIFLEDAHAPLDGEVIIEELVPVATSDDGCFEPLRLHITKCKHVEVGVRFNGPIADHRFSPAATIGGVHHWAARDAFHLTERDAAEHVLQIRGTNVRPDREVHIGTLAPHGACAVAFDLVPRKRVEG